MPSAQVQVGGKYSRSESPWVPQGPILQPISWCMQFVGTGVTAWHLHPGMGACAGAEESASAILGGESQAALPGVCPPARCASSSTWKTGEKLSRKQLNLVFIVGSHLGPARIRSPHLLLQSGEPFNSSSSLLWPPVSLLCPKRPWLPLMHSWCAHSRGITHTTHLWTRMLCESQPVSHVYPALSLAFPHPHPYCSQPLSPVIFHMGCHASMSSYAITHTSTCLHTRVPCTHSHPLRTHTYSPIFVSTKRPQESLFLCVCTHESTAHRHTCAPHLATPELTQSRLPLPWLWTPRIGARTIPLASASPPGS